MDNNKNRLKDRPKTNAELKNMYPKDADEMGLVPGEKTGNTSKDTPHKSYNA